MDQSSFSTSTSRQRHGPLIDLDSDSDEELYAEPQASQTSSMGSNRQVHSDPLWAPLSDQLSLNDTNFPPLGSAPPLRSLRPVSDLNRVTHVMQSRATLARDGIRRY